MKLEWVPAHVGTIGNETVNYFAKKSLEYSDQHVCNDIPYGINEIISIAKIIIPMNGKIDGTIKNIHGITILNH